MRTTLTLDPDVSALLDKAMQRGGRTFKDVVNQAIRDGLGRQRPRAAFRTPTASLGQPAVNLDKALQIAAGMDDDELVRKIRVGK